MKKQGTFLLIAMLLAMLLNMAPNTQAAQAAQPGDLFFSEYIEGSSYNKALEIYNGTGAAIDLAAGGYSIAMYFNGSATPGLTLSMAGTVADGDVFVFAHSSADPAILAQADQTNGAGWFNGDDAVVLLKGGAILDVIGQIGFDPGYEWGSGSTSTQDNTLQRKDTICGGDPDGGNAFDPALEWDGYAQNTWSNLGVHVANCVPSTLEPKLNEFSASTAGTDVEYVEIFGTPDTDYSAYTILEIEGDTSGAGVVDEVIPVSTTDSAGFWLANLPANALENGTISLLLVKDFTGAFGNDLDTDNDGVFDVTPWSLIADEVAVNDGGSGDWTYGTPSLNPNYDGISPYAPGGASRFPDGFDTESPTDWVRNDYDLAGIPGFPGTIGPGEAYNTPGAPNEIYVPPPEACGDPYTPIYQVQGNGLTSPLVGTEVALEGIVVGDFQNNSNPDSGDLNGFFVQDADGDGDLETSDGIFIYAPGAADIIVGDHVRVRGMVSEYYSMTEVTVSQLWSCSSGNNLTPTPISLPVEDIDDFEPYEGMLVTFPQSLVISEYYNYDRYGEMVLALPLDGLSRLFTPTSVVEPGAPAQDYAAQNALRHITLDDGLTYQNPSLLRHPNGEPFSLDNLFRGGDTVTNMTGVLEFRYDLYRIQPTQGADYTSVNPRPAAPEDVGGSLHIAAMNTLNYFITLDYPTGDPLDNKCGPDLNMECRGADADQPLEFDRQRTKLLQALAGLDAAVIGLNEMENTTGVEPLADIVDGLNDIFGAGTYAYIDTGTIGTDAIKVGLIYRPGEVTPVGDFALLTTAVDPRFLDNYNRPTLAQTFEENSTGSRFTVAVNHLKSKGSACDGDPDTGDGQGNCNLTRYAAAQALVDWLASDPTGSGDPDFIIMGDLNSYAMEDPIDAIKAGPDDMPGTEDDYTNLIFDYQGLYAYSYVFDGQNGYLDHALANASMAAQITGVTDWHINADEPDVLDYDTSYKPDQQDALYEPNAYRTSDHDAVIVGINLPPSVDAGGPYATSVNNSVLVSALGYDPEGEPLSYAWDLDNNGTFETPGQDAWYQAGSTTGIYPIAVQVTDIGGLTAVDQAVVAVYDQTDGFVTGGGWINTPDGKGEFSFDAKYTKKNPYPVAAVSYLIETTGLYFTGTGFDWLVIDGTNAWLRGTGAFNGMDGYVFLLTAVDGDDAFRIQIWDASGLLVHDSEPGSAEYAPAITPLGGGNITIH